MGVLISIFKVNNHQYLTKTMRTKGSAGKITFRLTIAFLFFVSLFLFAPQAFAASYRYDSVDVNIDCVSHDEVKVTVDIDMWMRDVLCWWINYGGNANINTTLTNVEVGTSKNSLTYLVLTPNGADFKYQGAPAEDTAAYDSENLLVYIAGSNFFTYHSSGANRVTGQVHVRYKTTLSGLSGSSMWDGNDFSLTPFTTNGSSEVPRLTVTINNANKLTGSKISDQLAYIGGVFTMDSKLKLESSDGKTLKFTGNMDKEQTANIFLSSEPMPAFTKAWREYTHTNLFLTFVVIFVLLVLLYVVLFKVVGKRTPKELRGFYYRDIPKFDNPIQAAYRALTYRTPYSLDKDAIKEQDLISYILLKNKDEGKAQLGEDKIKVNLDELDWKDRSVYEKFTLKKLSNILEVENNVLDADEDGVTTININAIKKFGKQLKYSVRGMSEFRLRKYVRDLRCYQRECLLDNYIDRKKRRFNFFFLKTFNGIIGVVIFIVTVGFLMRVFGYSWVIFPVDVILCLLGVLLVIRFIKKKKETCTDEEMALIKQVIGLKNWIEDFTTINEQPHTADIVWGDFIKWAYLLGVSEKAIKIVEEYASSNVADSIVNEISIMTQTTTNVGISVGVTSYVASSVYSAVASSIVPSASSGGSSGGGGGGGGGCR